MKRLGLLLCLGLVTGLCLAEFPVVEQGDVRPNDDRLKGPIGKSKQDELTIASFNVRNLGARKRCLKDFEVIADLVDEADVVMIQEAGLGAYDSDPDLSEAEAKRMKAVVSLLQIGLGDGCTRPTHLLCLAMKQSTMEANENLPGALERRGWVVRYVDAAMATDGVAAE